MGPLTPKCHQKPRGVCHPHSCSHRTDLNLIHSLQIETERCNDSEDYRVFLWNVHSLQLLQLDFKLIVRD